MADHNIPPPPGPSSYDQAAAAGPPASPPGFPSPEWNRGRRDNVLCFCEQRGEHIEANNCLFRDFSRDIGSGSYEAALGRVDQAYWPIRGKQPVKTIMGHVEFCHVLTRTPRTGNGNNKNSSSSREIDILYNDDDSDYEDFDDYEEDPDIVFTLTNRIVAVKVNYQSRMERHRDRHAEDPLKELSTMQLLGNDHPNVIGVIEALFDHTNHNLNVVMPYLDSGDLFEMLQEAERRNQRFSETRARNLFRQLVTGVDHIHSKGICHRDLSPENVMINQNNCVVIDMGMAIRIPYTDPFSSKNPPDGGGITTIQNGGTEKRLIRRQGVAGKFPYMSPEIYENRKPFDGEAVDVWTMGAILFCMVTGNRSYGRPDKTDPQFYWMSHAMPRLLEDWGIDLSEECVELLVNMLRIDPGQRYTLKELIKHPWLAPENPDETP